MRDWGAHRRGRPWFQSAPAIAGGRCDWGKVRPTHSRRFNPRPPLLAGDAVAHLRAAVGQAVSIRARHCWRAMHAPGLVFPEVVMFQSAPAIAGGRCVAGAGAIFTVRGFNPRPPLLAGDAWRRVNAVRPAGFQSAPTIAGGRCPATMRTAALPCCFNPRPPLLAGDAQAVPSMNECWRVSIRARHCWRAMPPRRLRHRHHVLVSIRARHCWRAMPSELDLHKRVGRFQSAPAIAGGRCRVQGVPLEGHQGFNPRPPLLAGDAVDRQGTALVQVVSIRARHCWRAMPVWRSGFHTPTRFQSAPAIAGGRCKGLWRLPRAPGSFNPRPPLLAGDAPARRTGTACRRVSIRARHCWRAMLQASADHARGAKFQSAPAIAGGRCPDRSTVSV